MGWDGMGAGQMDNMKSMGNTNSTYIHPSLPPCHAPTISPVAVVHGYGGRHQLGRQAAEQGLQRIVVNHRGDLHITAARYVCMYVCIP